MAFTDPQIVTIATIPATLNRVTSNGSKSVYKSADGATQMTISNQVTNGKTRRLCRLDRRVIAADPLTEANRYVTATVYVVIEDPDYGFTDAEVLELIAGFTTWYSAANQAKVLGDET